MKKLTGMEKLKLMCDNVYKEDIPKPKKVLTTKEKAIKRRERLKKL